MKPTSEIDRPAIAIAHEAFSASWSIRPESFARFCRTVLTGPKSMDDWGDEDEQDESKPKYRIENGVAIVPLVGVMMRNPGWLTWYGACDTEWFARLVAKAADDQMCGAIVLDIDSPGGSVMGTPEAAAAVQAANEKKPCLAYSGGLMCSAAYWVGCQASAVYASRSSIVGSIGCYAPIYDYSKWYEEMGVSVDVIRSGKYKGGNVAGAPVGKEYKANLQRVVDGIGAQFRADVKACRPGVAAETMEGQEFLGADAMAAGLVDSVTSYDSAVADAGALVAMRGK